MAGNDDGYVAYAVRPCYECSFSLDSSTVVFDTNCRMVFEQVREYLGTHLAYTSGRNRGSPNYWTVRAIETNAVERPRRSHGYPVVIVGTTPPTMGVEDKDFAGRRRVYNYRSGTLTTIDRKSRVVIVAGCIGEELYPGYACWLAADAHNVIRAILRTELENAGTAVIHAAGVVIGDAGILVIGDKAAGKTTALLSLIYQAQARYLANDRVFATLSSGKLTVTGWPTTCNVSWPTIEQFPQLLERYAHHIPTDEEERYMSGKVAVVPQELKRVLGQAPTRSAVTDLVVFPKFQSGTVGHTVTRIKAEKARSIITRNFFTPIDDHHPNWLGLSRNETGVRNSAEVLIRFMSDKLPCYEIVGNYTTAEVANGVRELLRISKQK